MEGSTVERSVLMEGAKVGRNCTVKDCLIGPGVQVAEGETVHGKVLASIQ
jgi:ADP-glucose pyrophosphorylase